MHIDVSHNNYKNIARQYNISLNYKICGKYVKKTYEMIKWEIYKYEITLYYLKMYGIKLSHVKNGKRVKKIYNELIHEIYEHEYYNNIEKGLNNLGL